MAEREARRRAAVMRTRSDPAWRVPTGFPRVLEARGQSAASSLKQGKRVHCLARKVDVDRALRILKLVERTPRARLIAKNA